MSDDDELMDDEIGDDADDTDNVADVADDDDEGAPISGGGGGGEEIDEHTIAARQKIRDELASDVEAFLARGGKIAEIELNVTPEPPKKPESDYRNRPI